jgi:RNA polymerase sigma-70 factor, ECF subfamily
MAMDEPLAALDWPNVSDVDLCVQIVGGRAAAFIELMRRYNRKLYRTARSVTGSDGEAEDVVQEAWTRAYAHMAEFRGEAQICTWLVRIVLNEASQRRRRLRRTLERDRSEGHNGASMTVSPSTSLDPEGELTRVQVRHILERAIDALPTSFRTVFILRAVNDMSVEEVAVQLGIPEATVRSRMHRSRALLRIAIEKKLNASLSDVFPFAGDRCRKLVDRVLAKLSWSAEETCASRRASA